MSDNRKRLTDEKAKFLGLKLRKHDEGRNTARYPVDEKDLEKLKEYRDKLTVKGTSTLTKYRNNEGEVILEWVKKDRKYEDAVRSLESFAQGLKDELIPCDLVPEPKKIFNSDLCCKYILTDYHLGMMAWSEETGADWDLSIAEQKLILFFQEAIRVSPDAETAIFANIGDFLHWDGLDAVTPTSKHILDADTRFQKLIRVAIRVIRTIIKMLLEKHKEVIVIMAEGNHDMASSAWLREMMFVFYEDEPRVVVDINPDPYYCVVFGDVCNFFHHGHKSNFKRLESVFISKFKKEFGNSKHVYADVGHLHHTKEESNLMTIEQHRTLAAKDSHSSRGGYNSGRDSKVITLHKDYGEVARNIINIKMIS